MGGALNTILGLVDSWLGRSFLLARYFPWLLFSGSNLALASLEFPAVRNFTASFVRDASSDKLVYLGLLLAGVGVLAYTLSPATQVVRSLLEGQGLWRVLAEPLFMNRVRDRLQLSERREQLFQRRARLPKTAAVISKLAAARKVGAGLGVISDTDAVAAARARIKDLEITQYLNRPIDGMRLDLAVQALTVALERNCAELTDLSKPTKDNCKNARDLDAAHRSMVLQIAPYAIEVAQNQEEHAVEARQKLYATAEMAPTRLGNDVAALRSYCDTRYAFDFDFFWPRLQLVMKNEKSASALNTAHSQVEFSILCLTLTVVFVVAWLIILGAVGRSLTALLVVVASGPAAVALWLWVVHASYAAYSELVRGAIDISRLDLLEALRQPVPKTMDEEKAAWERIGRRLILNDAEDVTLEGQAP